MLRIDDHGRAGVGAVLAHAGAQLALGDVLQLLRRWSARRCRRRSAALEAAERLAPRVGLDQQLALLAAHDFVVGGLDSAEATLSMPA